MQNKDKDRLSAELVLGVDIGGSSIKAAPVNTDLGSIDQRPYCVPLPVKATLSQVLTALRAILSYFHWHGPMGCGYPGVVKNGIALSAANVSEEWLKFNIQEEFNRLGASPVHILNDADAAGLAEMCFGAGANRNDASGGTVLVLTLGTGIGSAVFHNGWLLPNVEFGHIFLESGIEAENLAASSVRTGENLSWNDWGLRVNQVLNEMNKLISPDLIIIGGGVSENFDKFQEFLSVEADVVVARMGNDAGIVGSALAARLSLGED